jgi:hypothetical protein
LLAAALIDVMRHARRSPVGFLDVRTSPAESTATHSVMAGQEIPVIGTVVSNGGW